MLINNPMNRFSTNTIITSAKLLNPIFVKKSSICFQSYTSLLFYVTFILPFAIYIPLDTILICDYLLKIM